MFKERPPRNTQSSVLKALENWRALILTSQSRTMEAGFMIRVSLLWLGVCGPYFPPVPAFSKVSRCGYGVSSAVRSRTRSVNTIPGATYPNEVPKSVCSKSCAQAFGLANVSAVVSVMRYRCVDLEIFATLFSLRHCIHGLYCLGLIWKRRNSVAHMPVLLQLCCLILGMTHIAGDIMFSSRPQEQTC